MPSHSAFERAALVDALTSAGPGRPTLCDGWTTNELAAHLVLRERRPDAMAGVMVPALSNWTTRVQEKYAARPYPELLAAIRTGPPRASMFRVPGVDARANLVEHFVHCEDVRRASPHWTARDLPAGRQQALWASLASLGRLIFRRSPVPVTVRTPDGRTKQVRGGSGPGVDLVGEPAELVLYASGRKDQARVQVEGPDDAVAAFRAIHLKL